MSLGAHGGHVTLHRWSLSLWYLNAKCIQFHFRSPPTPASALKSPISLHPCSKQESIPIPKWRELFFPLDPQASLLAASCFSGLLWKWPSESTHSIQNFLLVQNSKPFHISPASLSQSLQNTIRSVSATALSQTLPSVPAGFLRIVSIIFIMWVCADGCGCL